MEAFLEKLSLLVHWVCFAIGIAVLIAVIIYKYYRSDLEILFISLSIGFSVVSVLVGAAIRWMFIGRFRLFPWKS
jgi:hypothetical protein